MIKNTYDKDFILFFLCYLLFYGKTLLLGTLI